MAEGDVAPHTGGKGISGFLSQQTAGLPNWAWLLVIAVGIAAAVVVPKLVGKGGGISPTPDTGSEGLGLAIDPTTGLPYAVSGLVPSGAYAGGNTVSTPDMSSPPPIPQSPQQTTPAPVAKSPVQSKQPPAPAPAQPPTQYVTVTPWPTPTSTLSGIAAKSGISLARLEQLNPSFGPSAGRNWDLIYAGEKVRVA
jgi:hypothetical protein